MRCIVVWGVIALLCIGCGGTRLKDRAGRTASMPEEFDPLTLNDDDISPEDIRKLWMTPPHPRPMTQESIEDSQIVGIQISDTLAVRLSPPDTSAIYTEDVALEDISGWRVQLSAHTSLEAAEKAVEEVRRRMPGVSVYNEFEPPWYKIRIGNCRTEAEADNLVREARRRGYTDAFKARTRIVVEGGMVE